MATAADDTEGTEDAVAVPMESVRQGAVAEAAIAFVAAEIALCV
jgi:hypothetical protein